MELSNVFNIYSFQTPKALKKPSAKPDKICDKRLTRVFDLLQETLCNDAISTIEESPQKEYIK